ncbi:hypothetical protein UO65_2135 [Actinokineospora spheciospongiae]|uniref:Band 7 domain-containing protein n=1 Tax=Actinokineospora spheciospongiae TaxID=909613 RepID=W7INR6_9PSEU|nr:hypothetical protein UO65_2135 [Actinokineospora spheciospongiae]
MRDLSELPTPTPGTVLVFETATGHHAATERRHLTGGEDVVVDAVAVALVDIRERLVPVRLALPSASPADEFTVTVDFRCRVTRADVVAAAGHHDVTRSLEIFLKRDTALSRMGAGSTIDQIGRVRAEVTARIDAFCKLRAPEIPGMEVTLAEVHVQTPADLAAHEKEKRDVVWSGAVDDLRAAAEDRDAARLEDYFRRGPAAVAGLGVSRGEINLAEAAEREYSLAEARRNEMIKLLQSLPEGAFDTTTIDVDRIFNEVLNVVGASDKPAIGAPELPRLDGVVPRAGVERGETGEQHHS